MEGESDVFSLDSRSDVFAGVSTITEPDGLGEGDIAYLLVNG
jgi:hypothetical protein